jgi:hypothetical protein
LKAPNGEIICASQGYATKASAEKGIEAAIADHWSPSFSRAHAYEHVKKS